MAEGPLRKREGPRPPKSRHIWLPQPSQVHCTSLPSPWERGGGAGSWVVPKWSVKIERYIYLYAVCSPAWCSHLCLEVPVRWFCGLPGCGSVQGQPFSGLGGQRAQRHGLESAPALMSPLLGQARMLPRAGLLLRGSGKGPWKRASTLFPVTRVSKLRRPELLSNRAPKWGSNPDPCGSRVGFLTSVLRMAPSDHGSCLPTHLKTLVEPLSMLSIPTQPPNCCLSHGQALGETG